MDGTNYYGISVRLHTDKMEQWIRLPIDEALYRDMLATMDAPDGKVSIDRCEDGFGGRLEPLILNSDIAEANYLAARIEEASPKFMTRLAAVMDSPEQFTDIRRLIDYTYNESYFDLFTDVHSTEDLAKHYIYESGLIQMPKEWAEGIDLEKFGANLEKHEVGYYTEQGYLIPSGAEWVPVYEAFELIPDEYRLTALSTTPVNENMKPLYPYSVGYARDHGELDLWRENSDLNIACAQAIDQAVKDSNYELYRYDLATAAKSVIAEYGTERVTFVLVSILQRNEHDARYSNDNRKWAKSFDVPKDWSPGIATHPTVMNGFVEEARATIVELEQHNPLATVEMSTEQNYNMIDGARNNLAVPKADLTDGQTLDEIMELAPETLPEDTSSVVDRIRDARDNPPPREKGDKKSHRSHDEREL